LDRRSRSHDTARHGELSGEEVPQVDRSRPCLATAVGVIVACKPDLHVHGSNGDDDDHRRCFTDGVTIKETLINGTAATPSS